MDLFADTAAFLDICRVDWTGGTGGAGEEVEGSKDAAFSLSRGEERIPLGIDLEGVFLVGVVLALLSVFLEGVALVGVALMGVFLEGVALVGVALMGVFLVGVALVGVALEGVACCFFRGETSTFSIISFSFLTGR